MKTKEDNLKKFDIFVAILSILFLVSFPACRMGTNPQNSPAPDEESPAVPSNLRTTSVLSNRVNLAWDSSSDNKGVSGYRIYRDNIRIGNSGTTSYSDSSANSDSQYTYSISAYDNANNESGRSNEIIVNTPESVIDSTIIDHNNTDASIIPDEYIISAKNNLHIAYQHTSHGSQIISGMTALATYPAFGTRYQWSDNGSSGLDIDYYDPIMPGYHDLSTEDSEDANGNTPWANATRTFLNNTNNYHINVVMWSWCRISGHNITRYITNMEKLISEYGVGGTNARAASHPVEFVFMTGHTEGTGESGVAAQAAYQIRTHCVSNNRWLIDYYNIECYDPDGNYFGNQNVTDNLNYVSGNWAVNYLAAHNGNILDILTMGNGGSFNGCTSCAHSDSPRQATLNCVLKAQAAWHLFARLAGWNGN